MVTQQVFLSYSHRDDEPYGPQNRRWVEEFERALRSSMGQRIGPGRVELWRDKRRLAGNEIFDSRIEQQLDRSAIFVTVLSQHYLSSDYCRKELQRFGSRHMARGDLQVDKLSRIVKVYRRAIDRAELRRFVDLPELIPEVDGSTGYDLYYVDDSGIDRDVLLDPDRVALYWQRADDIAFAIKRMLDSAATLQPRAESPSTAPRCVYLARTAGDMKERRDAVQRELEDRGVRVLPEHEPPEDVDAYCSAVEADLERATLSVHLIGARYGSIPDGAGQSGVVLQAELAMARAQSGSRLHAIFWTPTEITPSAVTEPRQLDFIERLDEADFPRDRAEYVRSSVEQLKSLVIERLDAATRAAPAAAPDAVGGNSIYLICDTADRGDVKPLQTALTRLGFSVSRPSMEGTSEELIEEAKANLVSCDVVIVVWGKAREAWVRSKLREAQQAPGWGRQRPYRGKLILIAPPESSAKLDFDVPQGVTVLQGLDSTEQIELLFR